MFESVKIIGEKQYEKAKRLFESANLKVSGPIGAAHQYIDMSNIVLQTSNGTVSTCKPAMGYSFAAGTTDGQQTRLNPFSDDRVTHFPQDLVPLTSNRGSRSQRRSGIWYETS